MKKTKFIISYSFLGFFSCATLHKISTKIPCKLCINPSVVTVIEAQVVRLEVRPRIEVLGLGVSFAMCQNILLNCRFPLGEPMA